MMFNTLKYFKCDAEISVCSCSDACLEGSGYEMLGHHREGGARASFNTVKKKKKEKIVQ